MSAKKRRYSSSLSDEPDLVMVRKQLKKALKDVERLKKKKKKSYHYPRARAHRESSINVSSSGSEMERVTSPDSENSDQGSDEEGSHSSHPSKQLPPEILRILGSQGPTADITGEAIHNEVAQVWMQVLQKGLGAEEIKELLQKYPLIANCKLVEARKLNLEVKKAITQQHVERDERLVRVQTQVGAAMGAVGTALTHCLKEEGKAWSKLIELLGDAGKLMASVHFAESQSR
ncbi:uncharacterized protein LOC123014782 [Tribolium madens]|uniref:uncharacterized protein LOC123014782 n=1 Tax=Tribolium madens TaxID=41895 RepID=UPI001CF743DB|nr:uncharacterized protein LOC123014782 [Tribolium madens]